MNVYSKEAIKAGEFAVNLIKKNILTKKILPNTGETFNEEKIMENSKQYLESGLLDKEIEHYYK